MKKPRVVVVGSSNTDMVVTGPRIPAPGETVLGGVFAVAAGGKGANQAVAAARLGAEVVFVARVGADRFGDEALEQCRVEGIDVSFIVRDTQAPTGIALIMVDAHGENAIAVASGANMRLSPEDVDRAYDAIATADVLMLQLEAPMESVRRAVLLASDAGVPIILNPAPAQPLDADLLHRIAYLTPNESETALLTGFRVTDDTTAARAAGALRKMGVQTAIVTMGAAGAWWTGDTGSGRIAAPQVQAVDTTAAGDAFNAGLAVGIADGMPLPEAIRFANCVGALTATRPGAQPSLPTRPEVEKLR